MGKQQQRSILKRSGGLSASSSGRGIEWAPDSSLTRIREIPSKEEIQKDIAAEEMEQRRKEISDRREKLRKELAVAKVRERKLQSRM